MPESLPVNCSVKGLDRTKLTKKQSEQAYNVPRKVNKLRVSFTHWRRGYLLFQKWHPAFYKQFINFRKRERRPGWYAHTGLWKLFLNCSRVQTENPYSGGNRTREARWTPRPQLQEFPQQGSAPAGSARRAAALGPALQLPARIRARVFFSTGGHAEVHLHRTRK